MARTNIEIDDALISEAMHRFGLSTKREAVDYALRRLVGPVMGREEMLGMEGSGWYGDFDGKRTDEIERV
ncbi:type II toxin-antitoxin system VapB family antitoxin [Ruania zhangjianzhongii]|uniref:type II toxin-antitoxin system VapB family antitoxin n=1 Tax=Ruania zhangjianzhongii TaxID=2603206 RepID=UPI0011CC4FD6|nr:type II toxin-antitoxin system VapB family antitoxin [Ruania zhangjianzhongii]